MPATTTERIHQDYVNQSKSLKLAKSLIVVANKPIRGFFMQEYLDRILDAERLGIQLNF